MIKLIIAALLLIAPTARAAVSYYKPQEAAASSMEGKKNAADEKADLDTKTAEVKKATDDARTAQDACDKGKPGMVPPTPSCADASKKATYAQQLDSARGQEYQRVRDAHAKHLSDRIDRVAAIVRKARKLDAMIAVYPGSDLSPSVDATAEVVKHLDAGEGTSDEEVAADLRKKLAAETARANAAEAKLKTKAP